MNVRLRPASVIVVAAAAFLGIAPAALAAPTPAAGPYVIESASDQAIVLGIESADVAAGAPVMASEATDQNVQQWEFAAQQDNTYQIKSKASSTDQVCLDESNLQLIANVCDENSATQHWTIQSAGFGVAFQNADTENAITYTPGNGTVALQPYVEGSPLQVWTTRRLSATEQPATPTAPVAPAQPADPATPADPADPATPADPAGPADPADPAVPADPAAPAVPVDPAAPAVPVDPAEPQNPAEPLEPAKPQPQPFPVEPAGK
jgi:hypothetical protein